MERLTHRDFRALLQCVRRVYTPSGLEDFPQRILGILPKAVPAEAIGYHEITPPNRFTATVEPPEAVIPDGDRIFTQHMHEHPILDYYRRTRDNSQARKISDFLSRRELHRLALYNELLRLGPTEDQIAIALDCPPPRIIAVTFDRCRPDFTERERLLLNLLRPHLIQAYHNAEVATQLQRELAVHRRAEEDSPRGAIILSQEDRVRWMTGRARRCLLDYFGKLPRGNRLPEALAEWVRNQREQLSQEGEVPPPREPLIIRREGRRLVVRLIGGAADDPSLLLLDEEWTAFSAASLGVLGLSPREAEVLFWVAQGKTNPEVGLILGMSPRTVQKHLEHIFGKLGVETRTAASLQALESLGLSTGRAR